MQGPSLLPTAHGNIGACIFARPSQMEISKKPGLMLPWRSILLASTELAADETEKAAAAIRLAGYGLFRWPLPKCSSMPFCICRSLQKGKSFICIYLSILSRPKRRSDNISQFLSVPKSTERRRKRRTSALKVLLKSLIWSAYRDFPSTPTN